MFVEVLRRVNRFLPQGNQLPDRDWRARHRVMIIILLAHTVGLFGYGVIVGHEPTRALLYATPVGLCAALAASPSINRRVRSCLATTGAMMSSAVLVQLSGGLIEAHFHFFVMLSVITIY